jgi:hypothetical protein
MKPPSPLRPNRIRTIEKPFAWLPCRLLMNGIFSDLSDDGKLLYLFLCLAADRQGMSFYGDQRIQSYFQRQPSDLDRSRKELIQKDLIAYDGHLYQVLSLPNPQAMPTSPTPTFQTKRTGEPERFADILSRIAGAAR